MSSFAQCGFASGAPLANLSSYVGSGSDLPTGAGAWTQGIYSGESGVLATSSLDRVYAPSTTPGWYTTNVTPPSANYTVQADFVYIDGNSTTIGILARAGTAAGYGTISGYLLEHATYSGFKLYKFVAGTGTLLEIIGQEIFSGTVTAQLSVNGSTITVTLGGVQAYQTTDTAITVAGLVGIAGQMAVAGTTGMHIANFSATPVVTVPTTATISGPASGNVGVASTNFTVTLNVAAPSGGTVVSLASTGTGDTFTPSSLTITSGNTTGTFTVTPGALAGARTVTPTSSGITFSPTTETYTGIDVTAPVVASATVNAAGTTLTVNFTETGSPPVLPASGATGFTLSASGGAATLSGAAISGTTYTATTSRTVQHGETLTLAYAPGNVTDSATTPNALVAFSGTSVTNSSTQASFTVTETALPSNHDTGTVTVHLVGTVTSWTGGTAFSATGVTGWSVSSATNVDATHTTVVLNCPAAASPPTGATGILTITDTTDTLSATTTVGTPTLAVTPASGQVTTTPSLTLTGADTLWTTETATGLFTVTGGTGASIGTPTVTANGAATAVLTVGSATGTLTITDVSTGAQTPFTATGPPPVTGAASFVSSGTGGIAVTATAPTGGSGAGPTYQWQSSTDGGTTWTPLTGATTLAWTDATATTTGLAYQYRCQQTRGGTTVNTNTVMAEVYLGGSFTLPGYPAVGNVLAGVGYGTSLTEFVGTLVLPAVGNVLAGVGYGTGGTQYTGTLAGLTLAQLQSELTTRGLTAGFTAGTAGGVAVAGYATGQDPATLVLGATAASWTTTGTIGEQINAGGSGGTVTTIAAGAITSASFASGAVVPADLLQWAGADVATPEVAGVPVVDLAYINGVAASLSSAGVPVDLTQALAAARALDSVSDTSLTLNDALHCAIAAAAGQETVVGTAYTVKTPHTATTLRAFTLDSATAPTQRT